MGPFRNWMRDYRGITGKTWRPLQVWQPDCEMGIRVHKSKEARMIPATRSRNVLKIL